MQITDAASRRPFCKQSDRPTGTGHWQPAAADGITAELRLQQPALLCVHSHGLGVKSSGGVGFLRLLGRLTRTMPLSALDFVIALLHRFNTVGPRVLKHEVM